VKNEDKCGFDHFRIVFDRSISDRHTVMWFAAETGSA